MPKKLIIFDSILYDSINVSLYLFFLYVHRVFTNFPCNKHIQQTANDRN